ncbi:MAG: hypothetical protein KJ634_07430 [Gammaproteobacteria bacterium]|nr:hypothetical protein [Gammaproteobacteria bacterium]MBU1415439.1 hypothetical protein [Gammaproteobacteria bacterium]
MRFAAILAAALALCACGSSSVRTIPSSGSLIPDYTLKMSPTISIALEKIVYWGALAGVAYMVLDPLSPNWEIEEAPLGENHIHFSLRMKRYYVGGAGEAQALFHRRAKELTRLNGFDGYQVVEYQESLDSSVIGSQRTATGVVKLTRKTSG